MVDTHCHLNFHVFDKDVDEVAKRAFDAGVRIVVNTGTSIPSSRKAVELAHKFDSPAGEMYAIVGVHPHNADKADREFEGEIQSIGFDGNITYKGIAKGETVELSELAKSTPLDRLLVETDAPFLTPMPFRGRRNEPKNVIIVGQYLANLKSVSFSEFATIVDNNVRRVFKKINA